MDYFCKSKVNLNLLRSFGTEKLDNLRDQLFGCDRSKEEVLIDHRKVFVHGHPKKLYFDNLLALR